MRFERTTHRRIRSTAAILACVALGVGGCADAKTALAVQPETATASASDHQPAAASPTSPLESFTVGNVVVTPLHEKVGGNDEYAIASAAKGRPIDLYAPYAIPAGTPQPVAKLGSATVTFVCVNQKDGIAQVAVQPHERGGNAQYGNVFLGNAGVRQLLGLPGLERYPSDGCS